VSSASEHASVLTAAGLGIELPKERIAIRGWHDGGDGRLDAR
jgi:hypothetical protein